MPNAVGLLQQMAGFGVHYAEIGFAGANKFVADLAAALHTADTGAMKLALFGRTRGRASSSATSGCSCRHMSKKFDWMSDPVLTIWTVVVDCPLESVTVTAEGKVPGCSLEKLWKKTIARSAAWARACPDCP